MESDEYCFFIQYKPRPAECQQILMRPVRADRRPGPWDNAGMDSASPPAISCSNCRACCCQLEVILMGDDSVPRHLTHEDEWGGEVMRRLDDGWCVALDRDTMLCTIYERRPDVCREYEMGGLACIEERAHLDRPPAQPLRGPL